MCACVIVLVLIACRTVGYTMDTMFFAWLDTPIDIDASVELPQFTLEDTTLYDCSQNYTTGKHKVYTVHCRGLMIEHFDHKYVVAQKLRF